MNQSNIAVNADLKIRAEQLFDAMGLNLSTAVDLFLSTAVEEQRLPISISEYVPNEETLLAMKEVEEMKKNPDQYKGYTDVDEMMRSLLE